MDRIKKKRKKVVDRIKNARTRPTKGGRRLGCHRTRPRPSATPNDLQNREKWRGTEISNETPARPNHTKSTSKHPFYATKVIPEPFTHIRGRFRRILYVEHRQQERRNVAFPNFARSGSVRPLQTRSIPKTGLGEEETQERRRKEGKWRRNDVNEIGRIEN